MPPKTGRFPALMRLTFQWRKQTIHRETNERIIQAVTSVVEKNKTG